jgi:hypothetical protein
VEASWVNDINRYRAGGQGWYVSWASNPTLHEQSVQVLWNEMTPAVMLFPERPTASIMVVGKDFNGLIARPQIGFSFRNSR